METMCQDDIDIRSAEINITDVCNSNCVTCRIWQNQDAANLSTEKWKEIVGQLRQIGVEHIDFGGGEPLLRNDIIEIIQEAHDNGFRSISLCTNAFLLNDKKINELIEAGMTYCHLSIDGNGETHDRLRGINGSFRRNIESLGYLKFKKVSTLVCTNVLESNISEIPAIIDLCKDYSAKWFPNLINNTQYHFKGIDINKIKPISKDKIDHLINEIEKRLICRNSYIDLTLESLPIIKAYLRGEFDFRNMRCVIGNSKIYMAANGDVFTGCYALESKGNLTERSLFDIVNSDDYKNQVKRMLSGNCPGCTCNYMMNMPVTEKSNKPIQVFKKFLSSLFFK